MLGVKAVQELVIVIQAVHQQDQVGTERQQIPLEQLALLVRGIPGDGRIDHLGSALQVFSQDAGKVFGRGRYGVSENDHSQHSGRLGA